MNEGGVEAEPRIELGHIGFANRCITTLLLGRAIGGSAFITRHMARVKASLRDRRQINEYQFTGTIGCHRKLRYIGNCHAISCAQNCTLDGDFAG